jgi:hypothetical protein
MKYWLTTHWPPRTDDPNPSQHYGVWLQEDKLHVAGEMDAGDLVLIYESGSGNAVKETYADGSTKVIRRHPGKQGVVTLAKILDRPSQPENSRPEQYADGSHKWWKYMAPTQPLNSAGFIGRAELAEMLGYSPNNVFRGYGTDHSGLAEISRDLFERLQKRFVQAAEQRDDAVKREFKKRRWGGPGGEGPAHLALKLAIAADPEGELAEAGLRHWATEYELPTGDTIDVVLVDAYGRFVAVEIEVDCDRQEVIGPLQCMKYRAMLGYLFRRHPSEVRAMLVAHSIHDDVTAWSRGYEIECRTRPRRPA